MTENDYYPVGSNNKDAPWNQEENPEKEIEVFVSITLSKPIKIKVKDYKVLEKGKDENSEYFEDIDFSTCNLKEAIKEQITLPQEAYNKLFTSVYYSNNIEAHKALEDLKDWDIDDYEVILE